MEPKKTLRFIVCGEVGKGKSTFINKILPDANAKTGKGLSGVTKEIKKYSGEFNGNIVELWDMPGLGDIDITATHLTKLWAQHFDKLIINSILFAINIDDQRVSAFANLLFRLSTRAIEQKPIDNHFCFLFTFCDEFKGGNIDERIKEYIGHFNEKNEDLLKDVKFSEYMKASNDAQFTRENFRQFILPYVKKKIESRTKMPDLNESKKDAEAAVGKTCYSPECLVVRKCSEGGFEEIPMWELLLGDLVKINDGSYERVLTRSYYKDCVARLISINLESFDGTSSLTTELHLTEPHYLLVWRDNIQTKIPSRKARINDVLKGANGLFYRIKEITQSVYRGDLMNIRTKSLGIIVNGLEGSCAAENDAGYFGHLLIRIADMIDKRFPNKLSDLGIKLRSYFWKNG